MHEYLIVARWIHGTKVVLEDLESDAFDPASLTPEYARALRRDFASIETAIRAAKESIGTLQRLLSKLSDKKGSDKIPHTIEMAGGFEVEIENNLSWLAQHAQADAKLLNVIAASNAVLQRREISREIDANDAARETLGDHFAGAETDLTDAFAVLKFGQYVNGLDLAPATRSKLISDQPLETCQTIIGALERVAVGLERVETLADDLRGYGKLEFDSWVGADKNGDLLEFAEGVRDQIHDAIKDIEFLIPWSVYVARRKEASEFGLDEFVSLVEGRRIPPRELPHAYAYCAHGIIVRQALRGTPQLSRFSGLKHNQVRDEFIRLDRETIRLRGKIIASECRREARPPTGQNGTRVDEKTQMTLLNYLLPQQRPRVTVRKMITRAGPAIQILKPCFMMGPQAVAQYLKPGSVNFDLVIMDEASQLKPEEAIGAIARGGQLIVVGDSKQLPPTSFFSRINSGSDDDEQFTTTDAESILDVCSSHFKPSRSLRWHYRSRHHSLIAFSNHNFYRNNLIVFPSPYGQSDKLGVRATYLSDAVYDNQTNLREAKRVVDAAIDHIITRPAESLGIATLNIKQRDLIAELLDEKLGKMREADAYREMWNKEGQPLFIKNLENVQGDERDAIIISTTFGKGPSSSVVRQNFGPISRQGGWRRLNVLFTRARNSVAIYTSLRPEDILIDGTTPEGTRSLRNYLEYARTGSLVVGEATDREPDSDFERSVIDVLRHRGFEVTPQLGVAGYLLDIAVKHPDAPGSYLAAIECDGASYHSAQSVRDRDRIRQEILESLGWRGRIWRIWSTDWFRSPRQEADKLLSFLDDYARTGNPNIPVVHLGLKKESSRPPRRSVQGKLIAKLWIGYCLIVETISKSELIRSFVISTCLSLTRCRLSASRQVRLTLQTA